MSDAKILERLSEISSALADIAEALESPRMDPEVAAALTDLAEAAQEHEPFDAKPIVGAIQAGADANVKAMKGLAEALLKRLEPAPKEAKPAAPREWVFEPEYHPNGAIKAIRARPMET